MTDLSLRVAAGRLPQSPVPASGPAHSASSRAAARRLMAVDLLRGLVMILMALDHTRDFFGASGMNPRDVHDPALFLTRWVTHFCAPVFIFLAGISAWLYGAGGRSTAELSRFLLTRGFWLIVLEFTVVRLGWTFSLEPSFLVAQVIWAIGVSMVVLAALIHLPRWAIAAVALAMIAGHNALDGIEAADFGSAAWVWNLLHEPALLEFGHRVSLFALYPLVPWIGVMAAGYCLGPVFALDDPAARRRCLLGLGIAVTVGFVLVRASNVYGDPASWALKESWTATVLSFLDCEKYPPSLLYLMMTLGPAMILLVAFERATGPVARSIAVFGSAPLFYYVLHLFLIHGLALTFAQFTTGQSAWLLGVFPPTKPSGYGLDLAGVYLVTLLAVIMLYAPCRWFAAAKRSGKGWWWSYL
jgi:uncharacterized membrane protein